MGHWSDKYIGLPYIPQTADCAAFAERVAREVFSLVIGLPTNHATGYRSQAKQIKECKADYAVRINSPFDGCPALFEGRAYTNHIGVMCWLAGEWWVLHASQSAGAVVRERLRDMTAIHFKLEGFYKWI